MKLLAPEHSVQGVLQKSTDLMHALRIILMSRTNGHPLESQRGRGRGLLIHWKADQYAPYRKYINTCNVENPTYIVVHGDH
jgi:hypothetical protein